MFRFRALGVVLAFALATAVPVHAQGAAQQIADLGDEIAALRDDLAEAAEPGTARARLSRAFIAADITFSRRHLDYWSTRLQDRWTQHVLFFDTQATALDNWSRALANGLVTEAEAGAALSGAMARIRVLADVVPRWRQDDVERMTERAFWTDLAHDIGCCGAPYYLALDEAGAVWSGADSPDPAAIAALEVIPMVPTDQVPTVAPATRAYDWLATRAETLAARDEIAPGARRALLVEASLLEDLFGPPPGRPAAHGLAVLADRTGFAARPVAPLVRMAALTESRHVQVALLTRALDRLNARADHLRPQRAVTGPDGSEPPDRSMGQGDDRPAREAVAATPQEPPVARDAGPATLSPADARTADRIDAILSGLRDPQLDLAGLVALADLAQEVDATFDASAALDALQQLDDSPLSDRRD